MKPFLFSRPVLIAAAATVVASGVGTYVWHEERRPSILEVFVFDLKTSQSIFIRTPDDKRILINGGSNSAVVRHVSKILPLYSRRIDTVIATDLSDKNLTGLIDVVGRYHVTDAFIPAVSLESLGIASSSSKSSQPFLDSLKKHSVHLGHLVSQPDSQEGTVPMGDFVHVSTLFPVPGHSFSYSRASPPQVVMKLRHSANEIVLAGDATKKIQKYIALHIPSVHMSGDRVIVTATAGATTDMSAELFASLEPNYLLYSKAISYRLPRQSKSESRENITAAPVNAIEKINIRELGGIKITSDGKNIRVSPLMWN